MMFYTFALDEEAQNMCTIVTLFGPCKYNKVPMGLVNSPVFAQARMEEVLRGIDDTVYIDDIGIFSNYWDSHITKLDRILDKLEENNFIIIPRKCEWAVKETDWLGYWLTPEGIKPWTKKVDAILKMKAPSNATELRTFLGMIT